MPRFDTGDTIVAIATASEPGLRGIVRMSGPHAFSVAHAHFNPRGPANPYNPPTPAWVAGTWTSSAFPIPVPARIAIAPAPRSYTTQDLIEIHLIGSQPVLRAAVSDCLSHGARLAEPGEFTLRAFLAGRLDLMQSEAVLEVIDARTPAQLDAALEQLAGGLNHPLRASRDQLLDHLAYLEATLDFTEEPDVAPLNLSSLATEIEATRRSLLALLARMTDRERADARMRVVLHGPPNAGKSSLFNALLGRSTALVSNIPGTTTDYLVSPCHCEDQTIDLVDTAGRDESPDPIGLRSQAMRAREVDRSDLVLRCHPADAPASTFSTHEPASNALLVLTKADLNPTCQLPPGAIATSAATGAGLDALRHAIAQRLRSKREPGSHAFQSTSLRCRESLQTAADALAGAVATIDSGNSGEFVALDLRRAVDALGEIVGAVVTDDLLDRVFSRFCIGK